MKSGNNVNGSNMNFGTTAFRRIGRNQRIGGSNQTQEDHSGNGDRKTPKMLGENNNDGNVNATGYQILNNLIGAPVNKDQGEYDDFYTFARSIDNHHEGDSKINEIVLERLNEQQKNTKE